MIYGFIGAFIEIAFIAFIFSLFGFTIYESVFYAAVISMLDPISIISIFEPLPISKNLYASLFGESVFTNAVAMILYEVLFQAMDHEDAAITKIFTATASFVMILLGSFIVGAIGGFATAYILKKFHWFISNESRKFNVVEAGIMTISAILTYLVSETFQLSGLVTILISGLVLSQYAAENLVLQTRKVLKLLYQASSYICRNTIFIFLGMCIVQNFDIYKKASIVFILGNIVIVVASRLIRVILCDFIANLRFKCGLNDFKERVVMWYSGIRGTLTYLLALNYAHDFKKTNGDTIVVLTLTFSLFTVLRTLIGSCLYKPCFSTRFWVYVMSKKRLRLLEQMITDC
eukprot:TRINITY_DN3512_c0_g1_i6.p1 TRINITY_DN3512_c0_g1~~TRINITY_DN3512_c0_g1_i6.p1  ORF type:complete len:346 (-),score=54.81 TRINITY_DN3512_c0_g1_i6:258-1295(-)